MQNMKMVAVWFLLLGASFLAAASQDHSPAASTPASLTLRDLQGQTQSLEDYRGAIVILNFWATWCVPCLEEMPLLASLQKRYGTRGVQVIGVSTDLASTQKQIPKLARQLKINFPLWVGATAADMQRLGLGEALPATAILDRDGRIAARILGAATASDLEKHLEWLLGDRQGSSPPTLVNNIGDHHHADESPEPGESHAEDHEHEHGSVGLESASSVPS